MFGKQTIIATILAHRLFLIQYVKEETLTLGSAGKEARAIRLITERASRRVGQMAFETALTRGPTVCHVYFVVTQASMKLSHLALVSADHCPQVECTISYRRPISRDRSRCPDTSRK